MELLQHNVWALISGCSSLHCAIWLVNLRRKFSRVRMRVCGFTSVGLHQSPEVIAASWWTTFRENASLKSNPNDWWIQKYLYGVPAVALFPFSYYILDFSGFFFLTLILFFILIREKETSMWEKHQSAVSCTRPNWGLNLQSRYVPWPGIELVTFWLQNDARSSWATLARATLQVSNSSYMFIFIK